MNLWHDVGVDRTRLQHGFPAVIEVPKGSRNKYELEKETGILRLDRVLHSAVYYPANYGFIPQTFCEDGDALDVLVLGQEPIDPLVVVDVRAIGVMHMRDEKGDDHKIVAVNIHDPMVSDYASHEELPAHLLKEVRRFFEDYKTLEHKQVVVDVLSGPEEALSVIREGMDLYQKVL